MPDSSDDAAFFELIAHPERWSDEDRRLVEFQLREQRSMLDAAHPKYRRRRADLADVVAQIEAALAHPE